MRDLAALARFIAERAVMPFAWGRHANDCAGYSIEAVRVQTARILLPGTVWTTARGAARVIRREGGIEALAGRDLRRIAPARAMRGDIAGIHDAAHGITLMVVEGETLVGPGETGNLRMPRSAMIAAWSVDI